MNSRVVFIAAVVASCFMRLSLTYAQQGEGDESTATVSASEEIRQGLTARQMNDYVDELSAVGRVITDLTMQFDGSEMRFDAKSDVNADKRPWIIQINLTDQQLRAATRKYKAEFDPVIQRTANAGRTTYHSIVWVQKSGSDNKLTLPEGEIPQTGEVGKDLTPLNDLMTSVLSENNLPGATLAVAFEQTLLFERGFGYSELDPKTPMAPNTTMRIASISKPITAVAVLLLLQDGKLSLDDSALTHLSRHQTASFSEQDALKADPRWKDVTVRHLLQHSAGFDRDASKDTVFQLPEITKTLSLRKLARSNDMVRYQLNRPLDFDPGTKYEYSNIGYCLLGRIIESVSGISYSEFVQQRILDRCGMKQTRLARTRFMHRADDEAHYYVQEPRKTPAVWVGFDGRKNRMELVDQPYGLWDIEVMDSHGGWTSTSGDLIRFVMALEHLDSPLLNEETRSEMLAPPSFDPEAKEGFWYGCGWNVRNLDDGTATYWHTGLLAGTSTLLVHRGDGYSWAVLFNCDRTDKKELSATVIDSKLHRAVNQIRDAVTRP